MLGTGHKEVHKISAGSQDDLVHPISYIALLILLHNAPAIFVLFVRRNRPFLRRITLEALILTRVVSVSLTVHTCWAVKGGHDFSFLGPLLWGSLLVLFIVFGLIMVHFPPGKLWIMIYGFLGSVIHSGFIMYHTNNLIKCHGFYEHLCASVVLCLDIIHLFVNLFCVLSAADSYCHF